MQYEPPVQQEEQQQITKLTIWSHLPDIIRGVDVYVSSNKTPLSDQKMFRSVKIKPAKLSKMACLLLLKSLGIDSVCIHQD